MRKIRIFDVILMDVQMPVMNGYDATRRIRESGLPRFRSVPILAMTAHAMHGDEERSFAAGMNAHLTKPIDVRELCVQPVPLGKRRAAKPQIAREFLRSRPESRGERHAKRF